MNITDLKTPESALAYLRSLDPSTSVKLPAGGEMTSAAADAVGVVTGMHPSEAARVRGRWDWTVGDLLSELDSSRDVMLFDYKTGDLIRPATSREIDESNAEVQAGRPEGVISVNGRSCYVA